MSTRPRQTETETRIATSTQPTVQNAPRTFSPYNTNPCPRMFADKWQVEPDTS